MMFSGLVEQAHATALEKGWHGGQDRSLNRAGALIALMHSEVVEASAEYFGVPLAEELADVVIRLADAVGWLGWEVDDFDLADIWCPAARKGSAIDVHRMLVAFGTDAIRHHGKPLPRVGVEVASACEAWRRDAVIFGKAPSLLDAIKAKLAKNKTRSFRHGGKLL